MCDACRQQRMAIPLCVLRGGCAVAQDGPHRWDPWTNQALHTLSLLLLHCEQIKASTPHIASIV